jgi:vesicle transport through interaction with t-SNAREs protein 1
MADDEVIQAYDEEMLGIESKVRKLIADLSSKYTGQLDSQIKTLLTEGQNTVKQMNVEARMLPAAQKAVFTEKANEHNRTILALKLEYERSKEKGQRSDLIGARSAADRELIHDTKDKLTMQNDKIAAATRAVAETEEVGAEIITELASNREKIESAHSKVKDIKSDADHAEKIVKSMQNRENCIVM